MGAERFAGVCKVKRGAPALVAAVLAVGVIAGSGTAAATAGPGGVRAAHAGPAAAGVITTVAGGLGGPARATTVALFRPCGVAFGNGSLYLADDALLRAVNPGTDGLTAAAGGFSALLGDGGPAIKATLGTCAAAVDHSGNLVIADYRQGRIRVVARQAGTFYGQAMQAGHIYTVAGGGTGGLGDGGPATSAQVGDAQGVALDAAGNLVIADTGAHRVRVVAVKAGTFYGQAMKAGNIYTVAGSGESDYSGDGGPATSAGLGPPEGVAVDAAGNLVIGDEFNQRVRVVAVKTGTFYGKAMTAGDIYTVAGTGTFGFSGDGGRAARAELGGPQGVALDAAGNLLIADTGNNRVRVVAAKTGTFYGQAMMANHIYTVAGNGTGGFSGEGGPATSAALLQPRDVIVDPSGNLVIADTGNPIFGPGGKRVRVVAARTGTFYGQPMTAGHIYTVAGTGNFLYSGDRGPATSAELRQPEDVAGDPAGDMLIADSDNNRIRVVAATTGTLYGHPVTVGNIYTVAGNGTLGFGGDAGPATSARLDFPAGVAADAAGNLLIADSSNNRIRVVAAKTGTFYGQAMTGGHIYTVAGNGTGGFAGDGGPATSAELNLPVGVAVDSASNLLIADSSNNRIRVVAAKTGTFYGQAMTGGHIYTVAGNGTGGFAGDGGPATSAELNFPARVTADAAGNLLIADSNNRIRVVAAKTGTFYGQAMTADHIYTVAGNGTAGFAGDGGPATSAALFQPRDVIVDPSGNLVIADQANKRVRVVAEKTGTFYGKAMTAGNIYTIAGKRSKGYNGDNRPAAKARLTDPNGVAVNAAGNLLIADTRNQRIRMITR